MHQIQKFPQMGRSQPLGKSRNSFDYLPAWDDHETRPNIVNYLAYNGYTLFIDPIYYDLLHAEPTISTNAYWDQVIPPEKK